MALPIGARHVFCREPRVATDILRVHILVGGTGLLAKL